MRFLKQNWGFLVTAIFFATIISFMWCKIVDNTLAIGLLGTTATLYFGVLKYKMENDKIFNELFNSFNQRYDTKLNDLLNTLRLEPDKGLDPKNKKLIIDYFNLCAEEYLWYRRNRIPGEVWNAWKAGILENLKMKPVKEVYLKEMETENNRNSYYGLAEELKIKTE